MINNIIAMALCNEPYAALVAYDMAMEAGVCFPKSQQHTIHLARCTIYTSGAGFHHGRGCGIIAIRDTGNGVGTRGFRGNGFGRPYNHDSSLHVNITLEQAKGLLVLR